MCVCIHVCMYVCTYEMQCAAACHCATVPLLFIRQGKGAVPATHLHMHQLSHMAMRCITLVGLSKLVFCLLRSLAFCVGTFWLHVQVATAHMLSATAIHKYWRTCSFSCVCVRVCVFVCIVCCLCLLH